MANEYTRDDIINLAVDAYNGVPVKDYSVKDSMAVLRKALVEANNGSTKLNIKAIRDGECKGLFSIVETILQKTVVEGFLGDEFFTNLVEFKSTALGDENDFYIEDNSLFFVSEVARGTQGIRRQRFLDGEHIRIKTSPKAVKIYDELDRVLSGKVDMNYFIDKVAESFKQAILADCFNAFAAAVGTASSYAPPSTGSYDADDLRELVDRVEAATGKTAKIYGTKSALAKINVDPTTNMSEAAKSDLYNMGYYGKFYGTDTVYIRQAYRPGTNQFIFDNDKVYIIAGDEKPIKVVNEGEPFSYLGNPLDNADLSQDYTYIDRYGVGVAQTGKIGVYDFA